MMKKILFVLLCLGWAVTAQADLVAHWGMDEGTGETVADDSGNDLNGDFGDAGTGFAPTWLAGASGQAGDYALQFGQLDGAADYVEVPDALGLLNFDTGHDLTVAMWVKLDNIDTAGIQIGYSHRVGSSPYINCGLYKGHLYFQAYRSSSISVRPGGGTELTTGVWYHIAGTWNRTTGEYKCYLNGADDTDTAWSSSKGDWQTADFSVNTRLHLGKTGNSTVDGLEGSLDDVYVFNHALTQSEILALMDSPSNPYPDNGATGVDPAIMFSWDGPSTGGPYDVYLGTDPGAMSLVSDDQPGTTYDPSPDPAWGTTYYWRIVTPNVTGIIWSFTTGGKATDPDPTVGEIGAPTDKVLDWADDAFSTSYDVYLGTDAVAVENATTSSGEYQGNVSQSDSSTLTLSMAEATTYYWRIDCRNGGGVLAQGDVWSFQTAGLMAHWMLDDGSGTTATDSSVNGYDGTLLPLGSEPTWTTGLFDGALSFDGVDDNVKVVDPNNLQIGTRDITISAWVNLPAHDPNSSDTYKWIYNQRDGTYNVVYLIANKPSSDGKFKFALDDDDASPSSVSLVSSVVPTAGNWYHVAVVVDRDSSENSGIFVDGIDTTESAVVEDPDLDVFLSSPVYLGRNATSENYLEGVLDDVRFYNRALTPAEVAALYEATPQAQYPTPYEGQMDVPLDVSLSWTPGVGATDHIVYFGTDPESFGSPLYSGSNTTVDLSGLGLELLTTYYWRVDEVGPGGSATGNVWSFTTVPPTATSPDPFDTETEVPVAKVLSWTGGGDGLTFSHDVYFGTDPDAVANATPASPEYKGSQIPTNTTYDPFGVANMDYATTYYWRIDEVEGGTTYTGAVWEFTTVVPVCDPRPVADVSGPEGAPDCIVDMYDLSALAAGWLSCGWVPVEYCP